MAFDTEAERQAALSGGVQIGMIPWTLTSVIEQAEAALALGTFPMDAGAGGGGTTDAVFNTYYSRRGRQR